MTTTAPRSTTPSMRASRVETTEAKTWSLLLLLEERAGTRPSSSSRKMMEGALLAACHIPQVSVSRVKEKKKKTPANKLEKFTCSRRKKIKRER